MSIQYLFVAATKAALKELQIDCAKIQVQTQIMDQSLATMLRQNQFYSIGPWSGKKHTGSSFFLQKFGRIL